MRALFEDRVYAAANPVVALVEVGLPLTSSRRDLWMGFFDSAGLTLCLVFKTRAEVYVATAESTGYIASALITPGAGYQSVSFTDNPANGPDLTGLIVRMKVTETPASPVVWGYTCTPDIVVCENIVTRLQTYRGSGKALEAINEAGGIMLASTEKPMSFPAINVFSMPAMIRPSMHTGGADVIDYPIRVRVASDGMGDPTAPWRRCRELQAAVESILLDECRTSYGEVLVLSRTAVSNPTMLEPGVVAADIDLIATFHAVWRDDIYPRY
jgi:hypothetical protein